MVTTERWRGKTTRIEKHGMISKEIFSEAILKAPARSQPNEESRLRINVLL